MGSSGFTDQVLEILKKNFEIVASFRSSKQEVNKEEISKLKPDLVVVASYGRILKKEILDIPKYGVLNIHPSLLPKFRGSTPIQTAILEGESKTGVTIIQMDEKVDHGPVLFQKEKKILSSDTFETLAQKLFNLGAKYLPQLIKEFTEGRLIPIPQDDSKATYTKILKKIDGKIELKNPPPRDKLERMIRAYFPWPGVFFETILNNKKRIIKLLPEKKVQVEGGNPISYKDFINGYSEGKRILERLSLN